jgi:hypothetical protein
MDGRQRGAPATALATLGALAFAGCFLPTGGLTGDDAAGPDHADDAGDVRPDTDVEPADDGGSDLPEGTCLVDRDCGDTTCADGSSWCNLGRCERLPPMTCPEDGIRCTRNYCSVTSATASSCVTQASNSWCPAGWSCDPDYGCVRRDHACSSDDECGDGVECTEDRCVSDLGVCGNDPVDADGDGVGDQACLGPGRVGDCDDADPEVNPNHPEVCRNLRDDDCDGLTDYADADCAGDLGNDRCADALPLVLGVSGLTRVDGDLAGYGHESFSSCYGDGPDAFFRVSFTGDARVVLSVTGPALDTVLTVLADCDGEEVLCNDDRNDVPIAGSRVEHRRLAGGSYVVVVSGKTPGDVGPYTLRYAVEGLAAAADCLHPIDATEGGTFAGYLTDADLHTGSCDVVHTTIGRQEQFVAHVAAPADLWVNSAGTSFAAAVYLHAGSCASLDERDCVTGIAFDGTTIFEPGWTGDAFLTLDYTPPPFVLDGDPGTPYRIEINP